MGIRILNDFELKRGLSLSSQAIFDGALGEIKPWIGCESSRCEHRVKSSE